MNARDLLSKKNLINYQRFMTSVRREFSRQTASPGDPASTQLCLHSRLNAVFLENRRSLVLSF